VRELSGRRRELTEKKFTGRLSPEETEELFAITNALVDVYRGGPTRVKQLKLAASKREERIQTLEDLEKLLEKYIQILRPDES